MYEKRYVLSEEEYLRLRDLLAEIQYLACEVAKSNFKDLDLTDLDKLDKIKLKAGRVRIGISLGEIVF